MTGAAGEVPEIVRLRPAHAATLSRLFDMARTEGVERFFHPHPLTPAAAAAICRRDGRDLYMALLLNGEAAAYGMLRGWDDGYAVPSLGLLVAGPRRRLGLGLAMMRHLHLAAVLAGADRVRLKVAPDNHAAQNLYRRLGYRFGEEENGQRVGYVLLRQDQSAAPVSMA